MEGALNVPPFEFFARNIVSAMDAGDTNSSSGKRCWRKQSYNRHWNVRSSPCDTPPAPDCCVGCVGRPCGHDLPGRGGGGCRFGGQCVFTKDQYLCDDTSIDYETEIFCGGN